MTGPPFFPEPELRERLVKVRTVMADRDLDGLVISVPQNVYYLTGLDDRDFLACYLLIIPREGEMALVCGALERVKCENEITNARSYGPKDDKELSDLVAEAISDLGLLRGCLGIEKCSLFLTPHDAQSIIEKVSRAEWSDQSGLVDGIRLIKSPLEVEFTRKAAAAADAGALAAVEAIREGASDYEVAAECHRAILLNGREYPGFEPFIRPPRRLGEKHTSWRGEVFGRGDAVVLEIGTAYHKYQAKMGRLVYIGHSTKAAKDAAALAIKGMEQIVGALRPGATAGNVYAAWHKVAWDAGLEGYRRHHCGYSVGIGFPPSWTSGDRVIRLAPNSPRALQAGMTFYAHSQFTDTGRGDDFSYLVSNTVLVTDDGAEILTSKTPQTLLLR